MTPWGEIVATPERGGFMGNRGCLHDVSGVLTKSSARDAWVTCRLQWKGIRRTLMAPGKYTELFFLDEPTALAAGHRPCNDCRTEAYRAFLTAAGLAGAESLNAALKADRGPPGARVTYRERAAALPDGAMVSLADGDTWLKWRDALHRWSPGGYGERRPMPAGEVEVITPRLTVAALRAGYVPEPPTVDA